MDETLKAEQQELNEKIEIWDNSKRAKTLIIIFEVLIGLTIVGIVSGYFELELLMRVQAGGFVEDSEADANDLRQAIIGLLGAGVYIASVVVFLNWFRRAYGNLHRLGINYLKQNESMAVWAWFIPIISLFRPVQIMNEIWTETQERIMRFDSSYIIKRGGLLIGLWWTLFIISNFIGRYVLKSVFKQDTIEQIVQGSQATLLSDIVQLPEALFVILIVYRVSKMEGRLVEEVRKLGGRIVQK